MNLTWVGAEEQCDEMNSYLAEPSTELEQEFLYSIVNIIEVRITYLDIICIRHRTFIYLKLIQLYF